MLTNMLTRGLASNTRSFSSRAMKVGKSSNMKMMSTLTGLGLGWSCLSQLNFGGMSLYGRINRAQCEAAAQASEPEPCCDLIKVGGIVLNNKMAGLLGAAAGVFVPGMNFLVWSFFVCDKHTKTHPRPLETCACLPWPSMVTYFSEDSVVSWDSFSIKWVPLQEALSSVVLVDLTC